MGFQGGSDGKESANNAGDAGSIPGAGREGSGNVLQYSCLENPLDRGAWQATVQGVTKSQTQLSVHIRTLLNNYNANVIMLLLNPKMVPKCF